jgi:deoxyribonuclease (pyrimidine dimer)
MTRINVVPVTELSDKHLSGEFHEITRIFTLALKRGSAHPKAPVEYKMGEGHARFFYDKLEFISRRYWELACELQDRAKAKGSTSSVDMDQVLSIRIETRFAVPHLFNDYVPTPEALAISRQRILERS